MQCSYCHSKIEGDPRFTVFIGDKIKGAAWGYFCCAKCALMDTAKVFSEEIQPEEVSPDPEPQGFPDISPGEEIPGLDVIATAFVTSPATGMDSPPGGVGNFYGGKAPKEADPELEKLLAEEEKIEKESAAIQALIPEQNQPQHLASQDLASELLNIICTPESSWAWGVIETPVAINDMLFHAILQNSAFEEECSVYCDEKSVAFVFDKSDTFNLNLTVNGFSVAKDAPAVVNYFTSVAHALNEKYDSEPKPF